MYVSTYFERPCDNGQGNEKPLKFFSMQRFSPGELFFLHWGVQVGKQPHISCTRYDFAHANLLSKWSFRLQPI